MAPHDGGPRSAYAAHASDGTGRVYEGGGAAYYASRDCGATWTRGLDGISDDVRYFYSLAVDAGDPENVLLSGARDPFSGHAVIPGVAVWSSLYRLEGGVWSEITAGLPRARGRPWARSPRARPASSST